jgi:4-amino-4-deoxy-L-arabinose transferase-like glycosyltransferase
MKAQRADICACLIALGATAASLWTARHVFERIPHVEDEIANLWQAEVMSDGALYLPSPPEPASFMVPFVVDYQGHRFGKYPPGWPAALSLGVLAGDPWLVNPLLAGLSVWFIYRLGSRIKGRGVGLLAALLAAASPMLLMLAGGLMGHMLGLFLTTAFILAWFDLLGPPRESAPSRTIPSGLLIAVAGVSLGLLLLTRPLTGVAVGLPFAMHGFIILLRGKGTARRRALLVAGIVLALAALLPLWQAALTGDPWKNPYTLWWPYDTLGFGPGHGRSEEGHNLTIAMLNTYYNLRAGLNDLFGWPYLSWLFLPFGLFALRRSRASWMAFAVFPSLVLLHLTYWVGSWLFGPRYYFEALPSMAIISAAGIAWLGGWLPINRQAPRWRRMLASILLMLLLCLNVLYYLPPRLGGLQGLYGISRAALTALGKQPLAGTLLIVHPRGSWAEYGTLLTLEPPFSNQDILLAYSRGSASDARLAKLFPERTIYHYYPDEPGKLYSNPR